MKTDVYSYKIVDFFVLQRIIVEGTCDLACLVSSKQVGPSLTSVLSLFVGTYGRLFAIQPVFNNFKGFIQSLVHEWG